MCFLSPIRAIIFDLNYCCPVINTGAAIFHTATILSSAYQTLENVFHFIFKVVIKHRKINQFFKKYILENESFSEKYFTLKQIEP